VGFMLFNFFEENGQQNKKYHFKNNTKAINIDRMYVIKLYAGVVQNSY
jgi:hypothetical protein